MSCPVKLIICLSSLLVTYKRKRRNAPGGESRPGCTLAHAPDHVKRFPLWSRDGTGMVVSMLTSAEYLSHLDADSHLLAAAAARGLDAGVPCCPGWRVRDLLVHVAEVQVNKADIVEGGWVDGWPERSLLPEGADPLDWFRSGADRLYRVLSGADPTAPAKTWADEQTVGFWIRRMAHETAVHRIDAEQAHGYESAIDPDLAADGVAEMFDVFITGYPEWGDYKPSDAVIRVVVSDRSWTVRLGRFVGSKRGKAYDLATTVHEPDATPATTISGEPDRVYLWMWGRAAIDDIEIAGDPAPAYEFREACSV